MPAWACGFDSHLGYDNKKSRVDKAVSVGTVPHQLNMAQFRKDGLDVEKDAITKKYGLDCCVGYFVINGGVAEWLKAQVC